MLIEYGGKKYDIVRGTDTVNDGMFMELSEYMPSQSQYIDTSSWKVILHAFKSDVDGSVAFSCYKDEVPFQMVEIFIGEVRKRLHVDNVT